MTDLSAQAPSFIGLGQRRNLAILFADLSDSTRLAESVEAEHYALMLAELRALYQRIVPRHGGLVIRIQGDGMLAIFGHPEAREDDGRRATEAALELHEAVRRMRPPPGWQPSLSLHSGIHAGLVLMHEGDEVRGRFELLGNAPNIAARLSDAARAGEILVSEETLGLQGHFFHTSERQSLQLRGRATPLAVFAVHGRAAIGRRFEASVQRGLAPFVGRERELALMEKARDEAFSSTNPQRSLWLSLRAGAGVGKTRLTEEFLRRTAAAGGCQIHRGYCEAYLSAEPLQPFLQMLAALTDMPEVQHARQLPPKARPQALLEVLAAQAQQVPQLLVIDDLQWADDASLQLLHRLLALARERALPLLLMTAARPRAPGDVIPAAGDNEAAVLELQPFSDDEATQAVQHLLPQTDPFIAAEVQRHAGGNALFIEELCHALANEIGARFGGTGQPGTAWLSALVESRMARLAEEHKQVLRAAAAIGNVIPAWLLTKLSGRAADDPAVLALAEQDFVFPDSRPGYLRFKHGITRDIVYEAIGLHERQAMHRQIAAELRADPAHAAAHELLAYHDGAAGDWASAAHHAEQAGDQALAVSALDRAKKQYRAALAALEHQAADENYRLRWIGIAQRFGMACVFDASRADLRVLQHAAELARSSEDPALIGRAEYWLGYVSYALGEAREGLPHCERGLSAAERVADAGLVAQLRGTLGQLLAAAADYKPALTLLDEAILLQADQGRRPGRLAIGLVYSLACRGQVLGDMGRFAEAQAAFDEAMDLIRGSNHAVEASVQGWRAAVYLWQGRWAEAQQVAAEAHRIGGQVRSLFTFAMGHAAGAYGAWMEAMAPEALHKLQEATAWLAPRGGGLFSSLNHGWLAEVLEAQDRPLAARRHIAMALRRGRKHDLFGAAMAYRAAARLALPHEASISMRYLGLARQAAERRGAAHDVGLTDLCAAEIAIARGQPAAQWLDAAEACFERLDMGWHLDRVRGLRAKT
ncbi:adenylate/guanylate cyclase domain-containing protein [Pelomonas sp. KK5]|uniref:adenylate/guanylate cyclase domain-containing protein n=1 Tax=Pelomonas sp. KK5 TaxID=1855730 RepID=UPI0009F8F2CE|nr:adenylate/guanylate cyclase domain-containing protein [Pelomonas sp. KK5]